MLIRHQITFVAFFRWFHYIIAAGRLLPTKLFFFRVIGDPIYLGWSHLKTIERVPMNDTHKGHGISALIISCNINWESGSAQTAQTAVDSLLFFTNIDIRKQT